MQWIKNHKNILIASGIVILILAAAFFFGGPRNVATSQSEDENSDLAEAVQMNGDGEQNQHSGTESVSQKGETEEDSTGPSTNVQADTRTDTSSNSTNRANSSTTESRSTTATNGNRNIETASANENRNTEAVSSNATSPEGTTASRAGQSSAPTTEAPATSRTEAPQAATFSCTISISCTDVLNHMDQLDPAKAGLIPSSGYLMGTTTITVTEGETVYDVLRRACSNAGIPLDANPYGSAYVRGINNLYEFDCGSISGWKYSVNGVYPSYGCSSYVLQEGDSIQWTFLTGLN